MIQFKYILGQQPIGVKCRNEQFIDPLIDTLTDFYERVYPSEMSRGSDPTP